MLIRFFIIFLLLFSGAAQAEPSLKMPGYGFVTTDDKGNDNFIGWRHSYKVDHMYYLALVFEEDEGTPKFSVRRCSWKKFEDVPGGQPPKCTTNNKKFDMQALAGIIEDAERLFEMNEDQKKLAKYKEEAAEVFYVSNEIFTHILWTAPVAFLYSRNSLQQAAKTKLVRKRFLKVIPTFGKTVMPGLPKGVIDGLRANHYKWLNRFGKLGLVFGGLALGANHIIDKQNEADELVEVKKLVEGFNESRSPGEGTVELFTSIDEASSEAFLTMYSLGEAMGLDPENMSFFYKEILPEKIDIVQKNIERVLKAYEEEARKNPRTYLKTEDML